MRPSPHQPTDEYRQQLARDAKAHKLDEYRRALATTLVRA
jgi:hypothetical protein